MKKEKKIEVDLSCLDLLKDMKKVGSEEHMDFYVKPINKNASFIAEVNNNNGFIDLLMTRIITMSDDFVDEYLANRRDLVYRDLQIWKTDKKAALDIQKLSEFAETYKGTDVNYPDLLYIAKAITQ